MIDVWFLNADKSLIEVTQAGTLRLSSRVPVSSVELEDEVGSLLDAIRTRAPVDRALQRLYGEIGRPIAAAASAARASLVRLHVDGSLRYLPFAALNDGNESLGDRLAFEQVIEIASPQATPSSGALQLKALGVTRGYPGLTALPQVADEICAIVQGPVHGLPIDHPPCPTSTVGLQGEAWLNEGFTLQHLESLVSATRADTSVDVLHIATHFMLRPGVMNESYLVLGDGSAMHLPEITHLDLSHEALVTLSACETGIGGMSDGREVDGLGGLLIRRGARSVIASLWAVEDRSTAALMRELYHQLMTPGVTPAEALRRAQQAMRTDASGATAASRSHPFYWAGFTVMTQPGRDRVFP
jgi:CHAT domain-containing protein